MGLLAVAVAYGIVAWRGLTDRAAPRRTTTASFWRPRSTLFLIVPVLVMAARPARPHPADWRGDAVSELRRFGDGRKLSPRSACCASIHADGAPAADFTHFAFADSSGCGAVLAGCAVALVAMVIERAGRQRGRRILVRPHLGVQADGGRRYAYNPRILDVARGTSARDHLRSPRSSAGNRRCPGHRGSAQAYTAWRLPRSKAVPTRPSGAIRSVAAPTTSRGCADAHELERRRTRRIVERDSDRSLARLRRSRRHGQDSNDSCRPDALYRRAETTPNCCCATDTSRTIRRSSQLPGAAARCAPHDRRGPSDSCRRDRCGLRPQGRTAGRPRSCSIPIPAASSPAPAIHGLTSLDLPRAPAGIRSEQAASAIAHVTAPILQVPRSNWWLPRRRWRQDPESARRSTPARGCRTAASAPSFRAGTGRCGTTCWTRSRTAPSTCTRGSSIRATRTRPACNETRPGPSGRDRPGRLEIPLARDSAGALQRVSRVAR